MDASRLVRTECLVKLQSRPGRCPCAHGFPLLCMLPRHPALPPFHAPRPACARSGGDADCTCSSPEADEHGGWSLDGRWGRHGGLERPTWDDSVGIDGQLASACDDPAYNAGVSHHPEHSDWHLPGLKDAAVQWRPQLVQRRVKSFKHPHAWVPPGLHVVEAPPYQQKQDSSLQRKAHTAHCRRKPVLPHTALQQQPMSSACTGNSCGRHHQKDFAIQLRVCARPNRACSRTGTPRSAEQHATNAASRERGSWQSQGLQRITAVPAAAGGLGDSPKAPSANTRKQARSAAPAEWLSMHGCKQQGPEVASEPATAAHVHAYWKPQRTGGHSLSKAGVFKGTGAIEQLSKLVRELEQQRSASSERDTPQLQVEASDSRHALLLSQVDAFIRSLQSPSESASNHGNAQEHSQKSSSYTRPCDTRCSDSDAFKPPESNDARSWKHLASRPPSEASKQLPDTLSSRPLAPEPQKSSHEHAQEAPLSRRPSAVGKSLPEADCLETSLKVLAPSTHRPQQRSTQDSAITAGADSASSSGAWKAAPCEARRESTASQTIYNGAQPGKPTDPSTFLIRQRSTQDSTTNVATHGDCSRKGSTNKAQDAEARHESTANRQAEGSMKLHEQAHVHAAEGSTNGYALPCAMPASTQAAHKLRSLEGVSQASLDELEALLREEEQKLIHMGLLPLPARLPGKQRRHSSPAPQQKRSCLHAMAEALSQGIESC